MALFCLFSKFTWQHPVLFAKCLGQSLAVRKSMIQCDLTDRPFRICQFLVCVLHPYTLQISQIINSGILLKHPGEISRRIAKDLRQPVQRNLFRIMLLHIGRNDRQPVQFTIFLTISRLTSISRYLVTSRYKSS